MSALGELFIFLIYLVLGILFLATLILTITRRGKIKILTGAATVFFGLLLFSFKSWQSHNYKENQLSQVGIYFLTEYPGCNSCIIELKENQTYEVKMKEQVIEKGDWHYEVGGDYWITYLDDNKYQLGNGRFTYQKYKLKYNSRGSE